RRPAVLAGLAAVGAAGLCYDIVVPADLLPAATEAAAASPGLTFVLDHLRHTPLRPRPDELWMSHIHAMAAPPNTVCTLSGALSERPQAHDVDAGDEVTHLIPYYETVLSAFGPGRMMFGSDWPVCTLSASYAEVASAALALTSGLSLSERTAIFSG